jgi:glutamyl-tRNA synthetase
MADVRVRFAPSPTGYLHVGGLRTALYNYLFARHLGGKFILRIEDTDRTRYVDGALESLLQTLKDCGLEYDEGPDKDGGFGPYVQSERTDIYREHVNILLEQGNAYRCFCTSERLDELRGLQKLRNEPPGYDGRCRHLSKDQVEENLKNNVSHTVRMRVPEKTTIKYYDEIRGWVSFESSNVDDQVLLKSDNFPTYHLANVVDDHLMQISHVIRGEEWTPSTPKHVVLYEAFGWDVPKFAHLPLLLNMDRTKLSKRQGDVAVEDYLKKGYVLQALLNFVALLGWNEGSGSEKEIFTKDELVEKFKLENVNKSGAVFDSQKLKWMNGLYVREMDEAAFYQFVAPFLDSELVGDTPDETVKKMAFTVRDNIEVASDINRELAVYLEAFEFETTEAKEMASLDESKTLYKDLVNRFEALDELTAESFKQLMKNAQAETGFKGKQLWMPYRVAITGKQHGPDITQLTLVFGVSKVIERIKAQLN